MKRLLLFLALSIPAFSQQFVTPQPDCLIVINLTMVNQTTPTAPSAGFNNIQGGCGIWAMYVSVSGFSSATTTIQSAPNNAGVAGSWVTFAGGQIISPSPHNNNPIVTSTQDFVWLVGYNPWIRAQLSAATGTGSVNGLLLGWRSPGNSSTATSASNVNATIVSPLGPQAASSSVATVSQGQAASGTAVSGNPELIGGSDGVNVRTLKTDASGDLQTAVIGNASLLSGQQSVTGSAAALSSNASKEVCVKANIANAINVYVGTTGVTISTGLELAPGQFTCLHTSNTNLWFVVASTTGASVSWALTN
jgi:hypothetical protein